jgi:hypothetical protein
MIGMLVANRSSGGWQTPTGRIAHSNAARAVLLRARLSMGVHS